MGIDEAALQEAIADIRPRLRGHAGDMTVQEGPEGVVTVDFHAACETCPAMAVTFAGLVRTRLRAVPGVEEVRAPQVHASPRTLDLIAHRLSPPRDSRAG